MPTIMTQYTIPLTEIQTLINHTFKPTEIVTSSVEDGEVIIDVFDTLDYKEVLFNSLNRLFASLKNVIYKLELQNEVITYIMDENSVAYPIINICETPPVHIDDYIELRKTEKFKIGIFYKLDIDNAKDYGFSMSPVEIQIGEIDKIIKETRTYAFTKHVEYCHGMCLNMSL